MHNDFLICPKLQRGFTITRHVDIRKGFLLYELPQFGESIFIILPIFLIVTWSTTERREIRNFPYPSVFELTGHQKLTIKKRNRNIGQFLAAEVTNPGQIESQQMFALCDQVKEIVVQLNRRHDWPES